jgi:hypothetical protein
MCSVRAGSWIRSGRTGRWCCGRKFQNVETKDDTDGLLYLRGAFGIDDGTGGGAGNIHLGLDLVAERITRIELGEKVDALMIGRREDG